MAEYARFEEDIKAWISHATKQSVNDLETDLKNGVLLCNLVNAIRPNTILKINTYNAAYRQMENIDNFLKVVEKLGVPAGDKFSTEDLFYGNNLPKVVLTLCSFANTVKGQLNAPTYQPAQLETLREIAAASQKDGRKRAQSSGLSLIEEGAKKAQERSSAAFRTTDRMIQSREKSVDTSGTLGLIESGASQKQQMISEAKRPGTDNIIKSTEKAQATAELGFIDSQHKGLQQMISGAKRPGTDNIIKSREQAQATAELGFIDSQHKDHQQMISDAKRPGTDNIIKSREQAQATAELGFIDSQHKDHQQMISDAKRPGTDNIIKSREQAQATSQLGLIDSNAIEAQERISDARKTQLDQIVRQVGSGGDTGDFAEIL